MNAKTNKTDARDEGRFFMSLILGIWLVFWGMAAVASGVGVVTAPTKLLTVVNVVGVFGALYLFKTGCQLAYQFVTGKI